jgi:hypothetical protein
LPFIKPNQEGDIMDFELIMAALLFGAMFGAAGYRGLMIALAQMRPEKPDDSQTKQLMVGEKHPALPAPSDMPTGGIEHPYRSPADNEEAERMPDPFMTLSPGERFRRFVIAVNDLGEAVPAGDLETMASGLDIETLLDAVECEYLDTPREKAAVLAFNIRADPRDEHKLANLIFETDYPEICISAMRCLKGREPVNNHTISAITVCAYGECDWGEKSGDGADEAGRKRRIRGEEEEKSTGKSAVDSEHGDMSVSSSKSRKPTVDSFSERAIAMAKDLLREWKEAYPARMRDFVLNRK